MKNNSIRILAIESSCDDTAAAVIAEGRILSNKIANQDIHREYGGVVPEWASRMHQENIVPVVDSAMREASVNLEELSAIAFTAGPGLLGSLLVGCSFAKSLALSLNVPLISVNHMEAHVLAHFIDEPVPEYPFICLTVSGGHTQLVRVNSPYDLKVVGETIDDAAGEAFDKIGKYLGLEYPAGPIVDKLAQEGKARYDFTKPTVEGLNFSFSGLKTAVLYFLRDEVKKDPNFIVKNLHDLCASVQKVIVDILVEKLVKASKQYNIREIGIAGGVSANSLLREMVSKTAIEYGWRTYIPKIQYCTDNAAMVAMAAYFKYEKGAFADQTATPKARLKIARSTDD